MKNTQRKRTGRIGFPYDISLLFSIRMAGITRVAVVGISVYAIMLAVHLIFGMAGQTLKDGIIVRIGMAFRTGIPFVLVFAGINGEIEIVMVESRRHPGILIVTTFAGGRKLCRLMVRIVGVVVIRLVATIAGIRSIIVISFVTGKTIVCNVGMRSLQHVIVVVDAKCGRGPAGLSRMTGGTVLRNVQGYMSRIG